MKPTKELISLYQKRISIREKDKTYKDDISPVDEFLQLDQNLSFSYYELENSTFKMKERFLQQTEQTLAQFKRSQRSLFYNRIDLCITEKIFFWIRQLYLFLRSESNLGLLHDLMPTLELIFHFYMNPSSHYIEHLPSGLLAFRRKKNDPFPGVDDIVPDAGINALWYHYLKSMNFFSARLKRVDLASITDDLSVKVEKSYVEFFWNSELCRLEYFPVHTDSSVVSALVLPALSFEFDGLLYKQKRKQILRDILENAYRPEGIRMSNQPGSPDLPELLPLFWSSWLRMNRFSKTSMDLVRNQMQEHFSKTLDGESCAHNGLYNCRMLEFLIENELD